LVEVFASNATRPEEISNQAGLPRRLALREVEIAKARQEIKLQKPPCGLASQEAKIERLKEWK